MSGIGKLPNEKDEDESDYEKAKRIIDNVMGYFQFKSENSEVAQKGIKMLFELRTIVKKNMKKRGGEPVK